MTFRSILAATAGIVAILASAAEARDLKVSVDARDVARKRLHTELVLEVEPGPLTLSYPQWIPGEHGPTGPLDTIIGMKITANGKPLAWARDPYDVYSVKVDVPQGVKTLAISLEGGLPAGGGAFSAGRTSSAALAVLSWNQVLLLPKGVDAETITTHASVTVPAGWSMTTALAATKRRDGGYDLEPASAARLIDSPTQMGLYTKQIALTGAAPRADITHTLSIYADDPSSLATPADFVDTYSRLVAEAGALFGTRKYRHYTWLLTLSDQVAHFGLEHHESSDDRTDADTLSSDDARMGLAELMAHEYVHSWNGKYRRPAGLLSPDYQRPMDASLLWVYEGMTQFWGDILPSRAGLQTADFFHESVAQRAGYFDIETGALWRPLADTAVAAQTLYNSPGSWSSARRRVDFYAASEFLWLDVDAELRARTNGKASIDDYVAKFYAGDPGSPEVKPYQEQDVYDTLNAIAPADWKALIRNHLDSTGPGALLAGLRRTGWTLYYSAEPNAAIAANEKRRKSADRSWSIGAVIAKSGTVIDVIENRAAAKAGMSPGVQIVAVGGREYAPDVLDAEIVAAQKTKKPIEMMIKDGDIFKTLSIAYYDGPRFPHIKRIEGTTDNLSLITASRTGKK